jgi:hypothetical protein
MARHELAQKQGTRYFRIDVLDRGHDGIAGNGKVNNVITRSAGNRNGSNRPD